MPKPMVHEEEHSSLSSCDLLSSREKEILSFVAIGMTNKEIAQEVQISVSTVENHLRSTYAKLRVKNRTAAVKQALISGIIQS
jgi:two-component system, NarL family, response regulator NreC